jgi:glycosyltransferase 2 family protein
MAITNPKPTIKIPWKKILALAFFLFSVGIGLLVSIITLQQDVLFFNFETFLETSADWILRYPFMLFASVLVLIMILTSGLRIHLLLAVKRHRTRFLDSLIYGVLARYYVLITPWGLGGQPITMGLMYKKNIPFGLATAVPMIDLFFMRLAMTIIGGIALVQYGYLVDRFIYLFAVIGYFITCIIPMVMILFTFHSRFESLFVYLIDHYWLGKHKQKQIQKVKQFVSAYRDAFQLYRKHPLTIFGVILSSFVSQIALLSIPFFVMASYNFSLGLEEEVLFTYLQVTAMVSIATVILGTIPTVGSAGAAEFTFATIFSIFLTGNYLFWTTFIWRFFVFYVWLFIGVMITAIQGVFARREEKRHHIPDLTKPLKVFLFHEYFYPKNDSTVQAIDAYGRYLSSLGMDVTVVVPFVGNVDNFPYKILPIHMLTMRGIPYRIPYLFFRRKYLKKLYGDQPMIYHTFSPFLLGQYVGQLARMHNTPLVSTLSERYLDSYLKEKKHQFFPITFDRRYMQFLKTNERIFTSKKLIHQQLSTFRFLKNKIVYVQHGINLIPHPYIDESVPAIKSKYNLKPLTFTLLFVGRLLWKENILSILETAKELKDSNISFQWLIVGEGNDERAIKKEATKLGLNESLRFIGQMTDSMMMSAIYRSSNLLVIPKPLFDHSLILQEASIHHLPTLIPYHPQYGKSWKDGYHLHINGNKQSTFTKKIQTLMTGKFPISKEAFEEMIHRWNQTLVPVPQEYENVIKEFYQQK